MPRRARRAFVPALLATLALSAPAAAGAGESEELVRCSDAGLAVALDPDGRVLAGGSTFTNEIIEEPSGDHGHVGDFTVLRLGRGGTLNQGFGADGHADAHAGDFDDLAAVERAPGGRIVGAGSTRDIVDGGLGPFDVTVWRHLRGGGLDAGFGDEGLAVIDLGGSEHAEAMDVDRRGRALVIGVTRGEGGPVPFVIRLDRRGELDPSFGEGGVARFEEFSALNDVLADGRGRITLGGYANNEGSVATAVLRLGKDGLPLRRFGDDGIALVPWPGFDAGDGGALAIDRDGRVLTATALTDRDAGQIGIARLTRAGELDEGWADDGRRFVDFPTATDSVTSAATTASGALLVSGAGYPEDFATGEGFLAKLTPAGEAAAGFGDGGLVRERFGLPYSALNDLAIQPDGRVVAVGWNFSETEALAESDVTVTRYHPDGARDWSFGQRGLVLADVQGAPVCEHFEHEHEE